MAVLDDYAKQLSALKTAYAGGDKSAAQKGTDLRAKAVKDGVNLNDLENASFKMAGLTPTGTVSQQAAYRGQQNQAGVKAFAASDVAGAANAGVTNEHLDTANKMMTQLQAMMDKGFNYDANTDTVLQSQKVLFDQGAAKATNKAVAMMNDRGIADSSMTHEQAQQIQQDANTQFNALIPQYQAMAYDKWHQGMADQMDMAKTQYGMGIDDRNFNADQAWKKADATGIYQDPQVTGMINEINRLKSLYPTATKDQQAAYHIAADDLRSKLSGLGIDASMFGSNKTLAQSSSNVDKAGIKTMASKTFDHNIAMDKAQLTGYGPDGKRTMAGQALDENIRENKSQDARGWASINAAAKARTSAADLKEITASYVTRFVNSTKGRDATLNDFYTNIPDMIRDGIDTDYIGKLIDQKFPAPKDSSGGGGGMSASDYLSLSKAAMDKVTEETEPEYAKAVDAHAAGQMTDDQLSAEYDRIVEKWRQRLMKGYGGQPTSGGTPSNRPGTSTNASGPVASY